MANPMKFRDKRTTILHAMESMDYNQLCTLYMIADGIVGGGEYNVKAKALARERANQLHAQGQKALDLDFGDAT